MRRNVFKVGLVYLLGSWALVGAADVLLPILGLPVDTGSRLMLLAASLGFPVALLLAWFFQFSRRGVIRTVPFRERRYHERRQQKITVPDENRKGERRATNALIRLANDHTMLESGLLDKPVWLIKALDDSIAGKIFTLHDTVTLGRDQGCDITLSGISISRYHAELALDETGIRVRDQGTPNGTFINDVRLEAEGRAGHGDTIRLAKLRFEVMTPNVDILKTTFLAEDELPGDGGAMRG